MSGDLVTRAIDHTRASNERLWRYYGSTTDGQRASAREMYPVYGGESSNRSYHTLSLISAQDFEARVNVMQVHMRLGTLDISEMIQ